MVSRTTKLKNWIKNNPLMVFTILLIPLAFLNGSVAIITGGVGMGFTCLYRMFKAGRFLPAEVFALPGACFWIAGGIYAGLETNSANRLPVILILIGTFLVGLGSTQKGSDIYKQNKS